MKKTKDLKNSHLKVRCEEHLRQAILSRSKELKVRPSEFVRFALEKAIEEIPNNELDVFLLHGNPNVNRPFIYERDGYILEILDENTAFMTYPNGDEDRVEEPFSKEVVFRSPRHALEAFHYQVEADLMFEN